MIRMFGIWSGKEELKICYLGHVFKEPVLDSQEIVLGSLNNFLSKNILQIVINEIKVTKNYSVEIAIQELKVYGIENSEALLCTSVVWFLCPYIPNLLCKAGKYHETYFNII